MTTGTVNSEHILTNNMAEVSEERHAPKDSRPSTKAKQSPKGLEAALTLLGKNDDTSRFVGLALLKPVLEQELSHENTMDEGERFSLIQRCWGAIPAKFLDRLLKARANDKRTKEEAHGMSGLAVAVMYAFMTLLQSPNTDKNFVSQVRQIPRSKLGSMPLYFAKFPLLVLLNHDTCQEHDCCSQPILLRKLFHCFIPRVDSEIC